MAGEATTLLLVGEPSNTEASKKNTSPALRVRFRDGTVAFVNMSLSIQLDVDSLLEAHRLYGNQERMDAELMDAVRGAAYKALERMTVNEARLRRGDVEAIIIDTTKDAQKRTAYTIHRVTITEIVVAQ